MLEQRMQAGRGSPAIVLVSVAGALAEDEGSVGVLEVQLRREEPAAGKPASG